MTLQQELLEFIFFSVIASLVLKSDTQAELPVCLVSFKELLHLSKLPRFIIFILIYSYQFLLDAHATLDTTFNQKSSLTSWEIRLFALLQRVG